MKQKHVWSSSFLALSSGIFPLVSTDLYVLPTALVKLRTRSLGVLSL